jgi:hypothetical protein
VAGICQTALISVLLQPRLAVSASVAERLWPVIWI